jgi:hypothetical protein
MTEKMLAEIEARAAELLSHFGPPDCATANWIPTDVDVLVARVCDDDVPLLIAHIHALEAQAARDAKVREAARDYQAARDAYRKVAVTDIAGWPQACVEVGYRYERLRRTIDDALAEEVE